jgi:WD40 repeat protein
MIFIAPVASATEPLELQAAHNAAHNGDGVSAVGFVTDGAGGYRVISGGEDATLRSWIPVSENLDRQRTQTLDHEVYDLEASIDGSILATGEGGWNGGTSTDTLRIWLADAFESGSPDGPEIGIGAPIGYVYVVAISPDNSLIAVSGFYGEILVYEYEYETSSLTLYANAETGNKRTKALAFSPDGRMLAAAWKGGTIQLWSFPEECDPTPCELVLVPVSISHGGTWNLSLAFWPHIDSGMTKIVSGTDSGMIKVWTILNLHGTPALLPVQSVPSGGVRSLDWSPDGSMIVAGSTDDITVYDANTLEILFQEVNAHSGRVNDVAFFSAPDGLMIASGGNDGALKLWEVPESSAGCTVDSDCYESNECTGKCVDGACQNEPLPDNNLCNNGSGICCGGSCMSAVCEGDSDCYEEDNCSLAYTCQNSGTCEAACENTACGVSGDGCCGLWCDQNSNDLDCPTTCFPTHNKEKGPRCSDGIDNDCDGDVDGVDPDC